MIVGNKFFIGLFIGLSAIRLQSYSQVCEVDSITIYALPYENGFRAKIQRETIIKSTEPFSISNLSNRSDICISLSHLRIISLKEKSKNALLPTNSTDFRLYCIVHYKKDNLFHELGFSPGSFMTIDDTITTWADVKLLKKISRLIPEKRIGKSIRRDIRKSR